MGVARGRAADLPNHRSSRRGLYVRGEAQAGAKVHSRHRPAQARGSGVSALEWMTAVVTFWAVVICYRLGALCDRQDKTNELLRWIGRKHRDTLGNMEPPL